ncbi:type II toxin-antitoxin system HicA family toxin [Brevibacillus sp. LEMMJ03]|jgi:hypothetical protein|nr:type II toxin-antitoxin system HicA family toxin [Brevibacillus sp. LEMMJ03]
MPSWKELKRFCENDGWELYKKTDHFFYRKRMPDGTLKRTKVSNSSGQINGHMWKDILKRQLQVTEEYFNSKI